VTKAHPRRAPGRHSGRGQRVLYPVERLVLTVRLEEREAFVTADGSTIRELAGIPSGNAINQSLAEATVPPGGETVEHFHREAGEIYHFTAGAGRMRLGIEEADVRAGDTVVIPPGVQHKLWNPGPEPLVLLCCSAPPYSHDDTVLLEG
jgi:mannose-6-phosphate isomerase-like protein (cupin superfamily)